MRTSSLPSSDTKLALSSSLSIYPVPANLTNDAVAVALSMPFLVHVSPLIVRFVFLFLCSHDVIVRVVTLNTGEIEAVHCSNREGTCKFLMMPCLGRAIAI
ncbi:Protein RTA1 [Fusarium oxysporum f. sp. albedinis]|nr:Protein RTA1 [Fusarium oxysporum f. sp. albedinis]